MIRRILQSALCLSLSSLLTAQQIPQEVPPATAVETVSPKPVPLRRSAPISVAKNTQIVLITLEPVSSATASNGQLVRLAVQDDLIVNGLVAIPKGTLATGVVTHLQKGIAGKQDGYVKPVSLAMSNGKQAKLWESAYGEDDCANAGPCWLLWTISAPLMPLILIRLATNAMDKGGGEPKPAGKNKVLKAGSSLTRYVAKKI
jgi:hypothetical protein